MKQIQMLFRHLYILALCMYTTSTPGEYSGYNTEPTQRWQRTN